ncbi:MAG TPA: AMIN domain-containing protein [Terriglobales bacterium]
MRHFAWLLLVVSYAAGQDAPATLRGVKVIPTGDGIQVDVSLSTHVQPSVSTASNPDRLILDFPNTTAAARQERIAVNSGGIRGVRYGLNSSRPPVTRVVVDLATSHFYDIKRNGTTVSLQLRSDAQQEVRRFVPPAAGSVGLLDIFHRRNGPSSPRVEDADQALKRPIPGLAPRATVSSAPASPAPNPSHPNRGSLQEGTVFPALGAPEGGSVPRTIGSSSTSAPLSANSSAQPTPTTSPAQSSPGEVPLGTVARQIAAARNSSQPPAPANPPARPVAAETTTVAAVTAPRQAMVQAPNTLPSTSITVTPAGGPMQSAPLQISTVPNSPAKPTAPVPSSVTISLNPSVPAVVTQNPPAPSKTVVSVAAQPQASTQAASAPASPQPTTAAASKPASPSSPVTRTAPPSTPAAVTTPATTEVAVVRSPTFATKVPLVPVPAPEPEVGDQAFLMVPTVDPNLKTVFKVKYVAEGVAYLDGGSGAGLAEGMKLEIKESDLPVKQGATVDPADPRIIAELEVTAVAETSAVTDIHAPKRAVKVGDIAYLSMGDAQALIQQRTMSPTREYPMVVAFTQDDPMDEEVRKELPRPPQPSVNRARGRIGFDYMGTVNHDGGGSANSDLGMVFRADITRIAGTYWNLSGYWRGRLHRQSAATQNTLQDLINRTYHLGMFYENPNSRMVAGVGRLYLPWAPSLDTIDGGYFGLKLARHSTAGFFAGSTPDPTSWSYNPDRRIAGAFINFEGGDYDAVHYISTSGVGVSAIKWQLDRPFVFFENTLSYKRYISVYDSLQADSPRGNAAVPSPGPGLARNFLTVRWQVHPRVELDFNHNYLRDIPTFDPTLVGTTLLDQYLFQGFSAGARVEVLKQVFVYTNLGSSNRSGDARNSLNQLYGLTFSRLPWWGLRADAHYSRFTSSFADGQYRSLSIGRNLTGDFRMDVLVGDQQFTSTLATSDHSRFVNANFEFSFGPRYFMQSGFTVNRGESQNYDQWLMTIGYRFDSKANRQ